MSLPWSNCLDDGETQADSSGFSSRLCVTYPCRLEKKQVHKTFYWTHPHIKLPKKDPEPPNVVFLSFFINFIWTPTSL